MKIIFTFLVLSFMTVPAFAQTQLDMVKSAQADYFKADKKLNETYKQIQTIYRKDSRFLRDLKQAQLAWIKFRDLQVALKYPTKIGMSSATPMCRFNYIRELTEQRRAELRHWTDPVAEGDVCTGTIQTRQ